MVDTHAKPLVTECTWFDTLMGLHSAVLRYAQTMKVMCNQRTHSTLHNKLPDEEAQKRFKSLITAGGQGGRSSSIEDTRSGKRAKWGGEKGSLGLMQLRRIRTRGNLWTAMDRVRASSSVILWI